MTRLNLETLFFTRESKMEKMQNMVGKTVTHIDMGNYDLMISCDDGSRYHFYHEQDCCESVNLVDSLGDPQSLVGYRLVMVDHEETGERPSEIDMDWNEPYDCWTITKLKFVTDKDTVIVRWIGESNGYYSERVDLREIVK